MARYLYSELASLLTARKRSLKHFQSTGVDNGNFDTLTRQIESLVSKHLPSGGGFDNGTDLALDLSHGDKLVFTTSFHHITEGMYCGWTQHTVTVTPSLSTQFNLRVSGRNRNDIKDYIGDVFQCALMAEVTR